MKINVLGTEYEIEYKNVEDDKDLEENEAYTLHSSRKIVMSNRDRAKDFTNKILRHEIIHAFLYESGLDCCSNRVYSWADNEEMVDWFAIQSPKIFKIYKELDIL